MTIEIRLQVDPLAGVAVYRQIMNQVNYCLAAGLLKEGDQLPSIRDLAKTLAINPATVVRAYSEMEHAGQVRSFQGKGFFVSGATSSLSEEGMRTKLADGARSLIITARQMGASDTLLLDVINQEIKEMRHE